MLMKTNFCVICNKEFEDFSLSNLLSKNKRKLCNKCKDELSPKYIKFMHKTIKIRAIYDYNSKIKELIYLFKGCYDYELNSIFLEPCLWYLKLLFFDYYIVWVPSTKIDDKKRGYNHVEEIYKNMGLKMLDMIYKNVDFKQSDLSYQNRLKSIKNFSIKNDADLTNKKILLVDDIYTSGTTIEACYNLIKKLKPKNIKVLVLAKTSLKK